MAMTRSLFLLTCLALLAFANSAHAEFYLSFDGLTVYDSELDRTWLRDGNYAATQWVESGGTMGDADGPMNWHEAVVWASNLTVGGGTEWRLPTMTTSTPRPNDNGQTEPVPENEFGWLWHRLGDPDGTDIWSATDVTPFINLPLLDDSAWYPWSEWYWTAEEFGANNAYRISMNCACWDSSSDKDLDEWLVWAVHDGNLAGAVTIDVKPGSDPNCININGHGVIPAAILGSESVDVTKIDEASLSLGGLELRVRGRKGPLCSFEYSNGDAYLDLVCHFEDDPGMWEPGDGEVTLSGKVLDEFGGLPIEGKDSICVVP